MNNTITIEQLAEKLDGKLWIKGDMKRIYLERGYNTKKMTTKTYVFQREDGTFGVSCYIDCPSQPFQWIKSQQQEVVEGVEASIERAIFEIENPDVDYYKMKEEEEIAAEKKAAIVEFEKNKERLVENYKSDYKHAMETQQHIEDWKNLDEATLSEIARIENEAAQLRGVPGKKDERRALELERRKYIAQPISLTLNDWMSKAITFANEDEYAAWKLEDRRQSVYGA